MHHLCCLIQVRRQHLALAVAVLFHHLLGVQLRLPLKRVDRDEDGAHRGVEGTPPLEAVVKRDHETLLAQVVEPEEVVVRVHHFFR